MRKINIFLLSVMILSLLAGCGKSTDIAINTESDEVVKETSTEESSEINKETDTEKDSDAVTEESETDVTEQPISSNEDSGAKAPEKVDVSNQKEDETKDSGYEQPAQTQPVQTTEPQTTEPQTTEPQTTEPQPTESQQQQPEPAQTISYSPQNVVALATAKVQAGGKTTLTDDLDNLLASGAITQEEYNEYYPYDGAGYYSIFVDTNMAEARDISGTDHFNSEDDIATYIADMLLLENGDLFLIEYAGTYDYYGKQCYEFRCYRA